MTNAIIARADVSVAEWVEYAKAYGAIEQSVASAQKLRIEKMTDLALGMPALSVEMFDTHLRNPLKAEFLALGMGEKVVGVRVSEAKTYLLAMTNGIFPPDGMTDIKQWLPKARKAIADNGIVKARKAGTGEARSSKKQASRDTEGANTPEVDLTAVSVGEAISIIAADGSPNDADYKARTRCLTLMLDNWAAFIDLAHELEQDAVSNIVARTKADVAGRA